MIYTSSYDACKSNVFKTYSISGDGGQKVGYKGKCYSKLAPKISFWQKWHDNIGKISEEDNNRYYVNEYWNQVLSKLDPEVVYDELGSSVLLCYENNNQFCHRHIVAAWFEILLNQNVPEILALNYHKEKISRPDYIKEYLIDAMKLNKDMKGFTSLRALFLYEKSEKIQKIADEIETETGKSRVDLKEYALFLRSDADREEEEYKILQNKKDK